MLQEAQAHIAAHAQQDTEIWDENWACWMFFESLATQWTYISEMNGVAGLAVAIATRVRRAGLNYPGVKAHAWCSGISRKQVAAWWPDIQSMELAVLVVDRDRRQAQAQQQE